jgi:hypothetical protein
VLFGEIRKDVKRKNYCKSYIFNLKSWNFSRRRSRYSVAFLISLVQYFGYVATLILTNSVAPEPEGSSPHSQQPAKGLYPEPGESTPRPPQPISIRSILIPSTPWSFKWSFSFALSHQKPVHVSPLSCACYMPCLPHP